MVWAWHTRPDTLTVRWHWLLLPGALLCLISLVAYAARFRCVLRMFDLPVSLRDALRVVSFAVFCQCFVPLGVGAELGKFLKLRGLAPDRRARLSAAVIVLEHLLGLSAVLILAAIGFALLRPFALHFNAALLVLPVVVVLALAALALLRSQRGSGFDARALLASLNIHRRDALLTLTWSMLMHGLLAAAVYVGSLGWGIAIDYPHILLVLASAAVFQAVPANMLGVGAADVAGTGLYIALGLPLRDALLLVSLLYGYRLLAAALGGVWELDKARRVWRGVADQG